MGNTRMDASLFSIKARKASLQGKQSSQLIEPSLCSSASIPLSMSRAGDLVVLVGMSDGQNVRIARILQLIIERGRSMTTSLPPQYMRIYTEREQKHSRCPLDDQSCDEHSALIPGKVLVYSVQEIYVRGLGSTVTVGGSVPTAVAGRGGSGS